MSDEPNPQDLAESWFEDIDSLRRANGIDPTPLEEAGAVVAPIPDQPYLGYAVTPEPVVSIGDVQLELGTDYVVDYWNNKGLGEAVVYISGIGKYTGGLEAQFNIVVSSGEDGAGGAGTDASEQQSGGIGGADSAGDSEVGDGGSGADGASGTGAGVEAKAANPMVAKGLTKVVKLGKAKKLKKAKVISGAVKFTKRAQGKVTYTRVAKGSAKCLQIAKKTGKVTVKKGTKTGKYKLKVKVRAAGNASYKAKTQQVTITIRVRA